MNSLKKEMIVGMSYFLLGWGFSAISSLFYNSIPAVGLASLFSGIIVLVGIGYVKKTPMGSINPALSLNEPIVAIVACFTNIILISTFSFTFDSFVMPEEKYYLF